MKIRTGFVSNSSSSSFVCLLPEDWMPTDEELSKNIENYISGEMSWALRGGEEDEDKQALVKIKKAVETLKSGGSVNENNDFGGRLEFFILNELIPRKYIIASFDVSSDRGEIQGLEIKKIKNILTGKWGEEETE